MTDLSQSRTIRELDYRILLVEDDEIDSETVRRQLARHELHRFDVTSCASIGEAQTMINDHSFDAILLDLSLPDEHGLRAVERVRSIAPDVPIVILTGNDDRQDEFESLRCGAQDYLTKQQVNGDNLVRSIRHSIERHLLSRKLEEANRVAESANNAKSEFLANMSHEIRTPLTAILGYAEILNRDFQSLTSDARADLLGRMQTNGEHLLSLISDILDLSKIEVGKLVLETTDLEPRTVLADVMHMMLGRAEEKGLAFETKIHDQVPPRIVGDPSRLRQIVVNLVGNAIKFTHTGQVRVDSNYEQLDAKQGTFTIAVSDTGIGLTETQISRLFCPFVQADASTTREFGGTGLGLTISQRLAEMLGGTISVESQHGVGSTFTLKLPVNSSDRLKEPHKPAVAPAPTPTVTRSQPVVRTNYDEKCLLERRILLAEDGFDNQQLITLMLTKAGAEVVLAENGQEVVKAALDAGKEGEPFDLILMDMQMPILDGYGATMRLRSAGYIGPIIALTAHAMESDRKRCLEAGCDDYMSKPIKRDDLIGIVNQHCRSLSSKGISRRT